MDFNWLGGFSFCILVGILFHQDGIQTSNKDCYGKSGIQYSHLIGILPCLLCSICSSIIHIFSMKYVLYFITDLYWGARGNPPPGGDGQPLCAGRGRDRGRAETVQGVLPGQSQSGQLLPYGGLFEPGQFPPAAFGRLRLREGAWLVRGSHYPAQGCDFTDRNISSLSYHFFICHLKSSNNQNISNCWFIKKIFVNSTSKT